MSRSDIIDDIDALIDEQLAAGETGQEQRVRTADRRCWHCGREWHGLAITKRLEQMRAEYRQRAAEAYDRGEEAEYATSAILDGYRYDQDDSDILCPGSDFIGPMPATMRPFAGNPHTGCTCSLCRVMYGRNGGFSVYSEQFGDARGLFQTLPTRFSRGGVITPDSPGAMISGGRSPSWLDSLPDNPWYIATPPPEPRWWRLDLTHVDRENVFMELEGPDLPTLTVRVGRGLSQYQAVMQLVRTREDGTYAHRTFDDSGTPLTLDIHTPNIDDCDGRLVWHEIDGPGGDYVHSREILAASPHIEWFTTRNLTHLLPRRTRMRLALERFNVQMQAWQERLVEQFTEIGNTFRRATDRIEYSYREAFTNLADGMRIGVDVNGQVRTGTIRNVAQRGDETTFDFTPDPPNRAARRRTPPRQDPYWVQRADRRRGRR